MAHSLLVAAMAMAIAAWRHLTIVHGDSQGLHQTMKRYSGLIALLLFTGCSRDDSPEGFNRLVHLAGLNTGHGSEMIYFKKTSGIDPYYLAKIRVADSNIATILLSPGDWEKTEHSFIRDQHDADWWKPNEMRELQIWTKARRDDPSYTEILAGREGESYIAYVVWVKTFSH